MIHLSQLKLPLEHPPEALRAAILKRLKLEDHQIRSFTVVKRSYDARKKFNILLIYSLDIEVENEAKVLARYKNDNQVSEAPERGYQLLYKNKNKERYRREGKVYK